MSGRRFIPWVTAVALALAVSVGACDTAIDPVVPGFERNFIVHGFLDSAADTQFVRIESIAESGALADPDPAIQVTTREASTGRIVAWTGTLITTDAGAPGQVYYALMTPDPGSEWTILVSADGVAGAEGKTHLPDLPDATHLEPYGQNVNFTVPVLLPDLRTAPHNVVVFYDVEPAGSSEVLRMEIPYPLDGETRSSGWVFDTFVNRDRSEIARRLKLGTTGITPVLIRMGAHIELFSREWSDASENPGMQSGYGFFGSVGRYDVVWSLDSASVVSAGFEYRAPSG